MPPRKTPQTEKPTLVFKGTVKKLKSATMKAAAVDVNTAIVTVDQLIEAPLDLAEYTGQDITVQLSGITKVKVGQQLIFNAVSWLYGESVAVRSLSEKPVASIHSAMLTAGVAPLQRRRQREQRQHFDDADLVVSGKVVEVRLPSGEAPAKKRGATPGRNPISEHDPKWREAVVEVDDVHKGQHKKRKIIVLFPASTDVMWYNAPKFKPGQQGHFILHKTKVDAPPSVRRAGKKSAAARKATKPSETYVALDPLDFQPYSEQEGIKTIIELKPS